MPHFIGIKLANCHKKTHFQSEQKKLNVISRLDWLLMGFGYFREISFTGKKFPIYMEPLTRGYWSTDMDRSHNQCILQHFRTRCKINLTYQSQNLWISKWSWSGKNGSKHPKLSISMAKNVISCKKNPKKHSKNQNRRFYYVNLAPELRNHTQTQAP